ncbi:hypothetical protein Naga_101375g1 [Nannochloropsis gaditana]|uniref:Uncharacterized protein n=1 Tax=Nannochloropsis gaditana TaxID=72520 RepID=W7TIK1_9STRA|nr:hypothetical protein Naga_101375g1 [Nannochloropsis gaditana]
MFVRSLLLLPRTATTEEGDRLSVLSCVGISLMLSSLGKAPSISLFVTVARVVALCIFTASCNGFWVGRFPPTAPLSRRSFFR